MSKKMSLIMDKFPYLKHLKTKIDSRQKLIAVNNSIKDEIPAKIKATSCKYEKAKLAKELLLIDMEQAKSHKQLAEDENFFKVFREKMKSGIDRANIGFVDLHLKALASKDEKVIEKIKQFKQFDLENNWEAKVSLFLELEELFKPESKLKKV